jgi:V8-like Glu-specific endopeptidase
LEQYWNVASSEPFSKQPVLGIGTGFLALTRPDNKLVVYTAGHVVSAMDNKDDYNVIFGFYTSSNQQFEYTIPATNIFSGTDYYNIILHSPVKDVLKHVKNDTEDYAILQLNQEVTGWNPLKLSSQPVTQSDTVYMIGHPSGLPMKVTSGAKVINIQPNKFSTLLTSYKGNSGSPVFHSDRHEVVGILISGEEDWEKGTLYISQF